MRYLKQNLLIFDFLGLRIEPMHKNSTRKVSVFGTVLSSSFDKSDPGAFLLVGLGILCGILLHDLGLMGVVATTRKVLNQTAIKWVSIGAGGTLMGFAVYFLYEFARGIQIHFL